MRRLYLLPIVFLGLTACTSMPTQQQPLPTQASQAKINTLPADNKSPQSLAAIRNWNISGMVAIRNQKDSVSASLQWQQTARNYNIKLIGPVGTGSYEIIGRPGRVELAQSNGQHFYATSPESLLAKQAGWALPVSNLYYWIRGMPVPNLPADQKSLNGSNQLTSLRQQGWDIRYVGYTTVKGVALPNKIFMVNPKLNVKILINQWQFS